MAVIVIAIIFSILIFLSAIYYVVKAAINNSELLKEIRVLLMNSQNGNNNRDNY